MSRGRRKWSDDGWAEQGGYMAAKKRKLNEQFKESVPLQIQRQGSSSKIFEGIRIYINGYTVPSSDELKRLMMLHGGNHQYYYSKAGVTHIIATNLPHGKIRDLKDKKVVKPDWIVDSIKAGRLLSCSPYLLYTQQSKIQPGMPFGKIHKSESTNENPSTNQTSPCEDSGQNEMLTNERSGSSLTNQVSDVSMMSDEGFKEELLESSEIKSPSDTSSGDGNILLSGDKSSEQSKVSPGDVAGQTDRTKVKEQRSPSNAQDPNYLAEFYSHSRLHHISTWGAEWKAFVSRLQSEGDTSFPGRETLRKLCENVTSQISTKYGRTIMHLDMDCFFVSVGLLSRPELKGKPVAVTHSRGKSAQTNRSAADIAYERDYYERVWKEKTLKGKKASVMSKGSDKHHNSGDDSNTNNTKSESNNDKSKVAKTEEFNSMAEIASCSYEARKAGIKNGMFMGQAKKLCPNLQTIPYDFDKYKEVSQLLYETIARYTHDIEAVSCDEMLIDVTDLLQDTGITPLQLSTVWRDEIYSKTGCTASAGLASNILLARMATRVAKPNGQYYLEHDDVKEFIKTQPIKDLPGIGRSLGHRLSNMGVKCCGDLQQVPLRTLQKDFGPKTGQSLYQYSRGEDDRAITVDRERKSVSAEINYGIRFTTDSDAEEFISKLSQEVKNRLTNIKMKGKSITLKLKVRKAGAPVDPAKFMGHGVCDNFAKSSTLGTPTDNADIITRECLTLLRNMKITVQDLRGIGIQVHRLCGSKPGDQGTKSVLDMMRNICKPSTSQLASTSVNDMTSTSQLASSSVNDMTSPTSTRDDVEDTFVTPPPRPKQNIKSLLQNTASMVTEETSSSASMAIRDEDLYLPSPSQVDPAVLAALPTNIRQQIEQGYAARNQTIPSRNLVPSNYNLPSKWDVSVVRELPADVVKDLLIGELGTEQETSEQTEVISEHTGEMMPQTSEHTRGKTQRTNDIKKDKRLLVEAAIAGPSGLSVPSKRHTEDEDSIPTHLSFSQIDPSFMEALPLELQEELKNTYKDKGRQNYNEPKDSRETSKPKTVKLISPKKGPKKKTSPGKFSRGPGRPRKGSPLKMKTDWKNKQRNIQNMLVVATGDGSHRNKSGNIPDVNKLEKGEEIDISNLNDLSSEDVTMATAPMSSDSKVEQSIAIKEESVNLCGRVEVRDVKALLKEWIQSCINPEKEDIQQFIQYMSELVEDKNLEMVDLLLKYLKRQVMQCNPNHWKDGYNIIYSQTQSIVKMVYGCQLKIT
ncbi:DNA repair protein REV1-like [Glandiceps talaboti]